ncbi:MAG: tripartite tricarboxylate transporter substrate binding protein [Ramlibacter sp.]
MSMRNTLAALAVAVLATAANAQAAWPAKPIHIVVPFTPGGSTDILARSIGAELNKAWGQAVIIDNVPGAGGSLGADRVAKAPADGYTLLMGHIGTLAATPSIYPKLPYDPIKSFAPVAWVARVPNVLVVNPKVKAANLAEFLALARAHPGQLNYASGGNGSAAHIAMEYLKLKSGTFMVHVPYRGTAPAVNDVIAGQVDAIFTGAPAVMPFVKSGQLRALAVSSPKRLQSLPDLPTVAESGIKELAGFEADQWYGIVAPAGTPPDVVAKLNAQINASLNAPVMKTRLQAEGAEATPTTPEIFGRLIASEIERWRPVVKAGKVRPE